MAPLVSSGSSNQQLPESDVLKQTLYKALDKSSRNAYFFIMVSRTHNPLPLLTGFILAAACLSCHPTQPDNKPSELRGIWLTNVDSHVLESRARIAGAMTFLHEHNFNAVFPVVWNKGVTLYPSPTMDRLFGIPIDTAYRGRDPLAEIVAQAHARGIAVIPWFEFGFSSSMNRNGGHLLRRRFIPRPSRFWITSATPHRGDFQSRHDNILRHLNGQRPHQGSS
jgi:hypothetical protein